MFKRVLQPVLRVPDDIVLRYGPIPIFSASLEKDLLDSISNTFGTFTRASTATYTPVGASVIHSAAINTARFESNGLLLEPAGTNYIINSHGEANDGTDWDDWDYSAPFDTYSLVAASDVFDSTDFPNAYWQRCQHTFDGVEATGTTIMSLKKELLIYQDGPYDVGDVVTISFYMSGTINFSTDKNLRVYLLGYDSASSQTESYLVDTVFVSGTYDKQRVQIHYTVTDGTTDRWTLHIGRIVSALTQPLSGDTMDVSITGIQFETSPVATSYTPTVAATATRATEAGYSYWPFASLNPAVLSSMSGVGTMLVQVTFGYDYDEQTEATSGVVAVTSSVVSLLSTTSATGGLRTNDGTTNIRNDIAFVKNTLYNPFVQWGYENSGEKFRNGHYDGSLNILEDDFDGAFVAGTDLKLGILAGGPIWIKNLVFYNRKITESEIANYFNNL